MAEKKLEDLPPSYSNLGYDSEPVAGPSAPKLNQGSILEMLKNYNNAPEARPSAPSLNQEGSVLPVLQAYQATPTAACLEVPLGPGPLIYNPPSLVFEEIYDACARYVDDHCCYGSRFIKKMKLTEIFNTGVYHYTLESFGEMRESAWHSEPYKGGAIDSHGLPPDPWDIPVPAEKMFVDGKERRVIPHTDKVETCGKCYGSGEVRCGACYGSRTESCSSCGGSGRDSDDERCDSCGGSGSTTCWSCDGSGKETCGKCDGYGEIKKCRMLIVTWKNHVSDYVSDSGKLPQEKIKKARGIHMLKQERTQLQPLTVAPEESVNAVSERLLHMHQTTYANELILQQRHLLRVVPFTRVTYKWKDREGEFYVYDTDRKVYFDYYPQQCCCCTCC